MNPPLLPSLPWLAPMLLLALLGPAIGIDLLLRMRAAAAGARLQWLVAPAVVLGTTQWALLVLVIAGAELPLVVGFDAAETFVGWLLSVGVAGTAASILASTQDPARRLPMLGAVHGMGAALICLVVLQSANLHAAALAQWPVLAGAAALSGGAAAVSIWLLFGLHQPVPGELRRGVAMLALGAGALGAAALAHSAVDPAQHAAAPLAGGVPAAAMALVATSGALAMFVTIAVAIYFQARLHRSLRAAHSELERQAFTDTVTELPNRQRFDAALAGAVDRADREHLGLAVLCLNLDGFRPINEAFGHLSGDQMLRDMGERMRAAAGAESFVARLAGDEFLVLVQGVTEVEALAALAGDLLRAVERPLRAGRREVMLSASVGIARYPEHGAMSTLIAHAEAAMRMAKSHGGATYGFFEPRMLQGAREQADLLRDLKLAIAERQFELFYQPKIDAPSGEITGAEALLRWHCPRRGIVSPTVFVPIAERYGLINTLGRWVIDEACRQIRAWRDEGLRMRVAVNLSAHQLRQPDIADHIAEALQRHGVNPRLLTCEITESVAMDDAETTAQLFTRLAEVGVHISIDDFGTGYSSLSYLRKLPAEELKIDRGFVLDLETSEDARSVVDAIVKLAQSLGLKVVAEGVETEAQGRILRTMGCNQLQGFLYAKPMSAAALALWAMQDDGPTALDFRESLFASTLPADLD